MKILLLQDDIYLPSYAGGIKANRCLMEGFPGLGHECMAIAPALTRSPDGPRSEAEFHREMAGRGLLVRETDNGVQSYEYRDVRVEAVLSAATEQRAAHIRRSIGRFRPDLILVADDKRRYLLPSAMDGAPDRVMTVLQTIISLPFGPLSTAPDPRQTGLLRRTLGNFVISRYMAAYMQDHEGIDSTLINLPVYGSGPFPDLGDPRRGFITMINPCEMKGLPIFLALAEEFPELEFAAVPTWGSNPDVLHSLQRRANVTVLEAADDIETILRQTRILLAPSLWPETFGYVVTEAMLRGIPALASDTGGLPEAKLGVDYVLPVAPARPAGGDFIVPDQDTGPWSRALRALVDDPDHYRCLSAESRRAATAFVRRANETAYDLILGPVTADRGVA